MVQRRKTAALELWRSLNLKRPSCPALTNLAMVWISKQSSVSTAETTDPKTRRRCPTQTCATGAHEERGVKRLLGLLSTMEMKAKWPLESCHRQQEGGRKKSQ